MYITIRALALILISTIQALQGTFKFENSLKRKPMSLFSSRPKPKNRYKVYFFI